MKLFGTIEKAVANDDGTVTVSGYASSEDVDSDGEIITAEAMKAALPDYMKFANIREMHQPSAAGIAIKAEVHSDGRTYIEALIVDDGAVKKVKTQVYKGFSIGARVTGRDTLNKNIITGIRLSEISLVDRPANPSAVFEMWKGEDMKKDPAEANPADEAKKDDAVEMADKADDKPEDEKDPKPEDAKKEDEADADKSATDAADLEVKKGMFEVARLAGLIQELQWLQECCASEADWEGDNSPIPAELRNIILALSGTLKGMVAEETKELTAAKADGGSEPNPGTDTIEKAGNRNNKADQDRVQKMHDMAIELGASCGDSEKLHKHDDVTKVQKELTDTLEKNVQLEKRVKELEAMPQPAKAALKVVEKSDDYQEVAAAEPEPAQDDIIGQIKKVHRHGPTIKVGI